MNDIQLPEKSGKDTAHAITKGILGAIPFAGSLVGELFEVVVEPSYNKRLQQWLEHISIVLEELKEKQGIPIEALAGNEEFVSTFIKTSQIAQRTHIEEKRMLLSNSIRNTILHPLEFDKQQIFLEILDRLTDRHIKMLQMISEFQQKDPDFDQDILEGMINEKLFGGDKGLMDLFFEQLKQYHMLWYIQTKKKTDKKIIWTIHLSKIGASFLHFVQY